MLVDQCNDCYLGGGISECEMEGSGFAENNLCIYVIFVEIFVTSDCLYINITDDSLAVAKIKNSKQVASPVRFPHLSIQDFTGSVCKGCRLASGDVNWNDNCDCTETSRVYFFQFELVTFELEITKDSDDGDDYLVVSFEFWLAGKFYVTDTLQYLDSVTVGSGEAAYQNLVHNRYDLLAVTKQTRMPLVISVQEKQFEIVCSVFDERSCPFEGSTYAELRLSSKRIAEDQSRFFVYSIRRISLDIHIQLTSFKLDPCRPPPTYWQNDDGYTCNPTKPDEDYNMNIDGVCTDDPKNKDRQYMHVPGKEQGDRLNITKYTFADGRKTILLLPGDMTRLKPWVLTENIDILEIVLETDGSQCKDKGYDIKFHISTTSFGSVRTMQELSSSPVPTTTCRMLYCVAECCSVLCKTKALCTLSTSPVDRARAL